MNKQQLFIFSGAMILTSALVSMGTMMGGVWYMQQQNKATSTPHSEEGSFFSGFTFPFESDNAKSANGPSFHPLDKIVLSVKGNRQTHFVMLELAIENRHPERIKAIDDYMPVVQNALLKLFASKHYDELQQQGGIDALQDEVKATLMQAFAKTDIVRDIDDVLITKYVVQ